VGRKIGGQNRKEWNWFIKYLQDKDIRSYLEIGAREGIALKYLVERLPIEFVAAVDLPEAECGNPDSERKLGENLRSLKCKHALIIGDSRDPKIIEAARGKYDLVFIDGDHSYIGVASDYKNYGYMGRYVAFHDINHRQTEKAHGATIFWNKLDGDKIEFIANGSKKGIGLVNQNN